jgi:predicted O-methyltransferase YrrM
MDATKRVLRLKLFLGGLLCNKQSVLRGGFATMNDAKSPLGKMALVAGALIADPASIPTYLTTRKSVPLDVGLPWISLKAIRFLERFLTPKMTVLEYGSGGSTIFFARRCKRVIAIEDDPVWLGAVRQRLDALGLTNTEVRLCETGSIYTSSSAEFRDSSYLKAADGLNPDLVLIDGLDEIQPYGRENYEPRRSICFHHVEAMMAANGGVILVDDASLYPALRRQNWAKHSQSLSGIGPCRNGVTRTDIFFYSA